MVCNDHNYYLPIAKADPNAANAAAWAAYYQQQQFYQQPGSGAPSAQSNPGQPESNSGMLVIWLDYLFFLELFEANSN